MIPKHPSANKLHKILKQAYLQRADAAHPPVDSNALMRRIRQLGDTGTAASPGAFLDRFFWRLVPAAGALIVVLALVAAGLDFAPDQAWSLLSYENEAADMVQNLLL
ncbi:MAG: hypothetical protein QNJ04_09195 [Desulfobacterales bacterium]|nr:hypothetical protein [Desulfobacterales bacterium]